MYLYDILVALVLYPVKGVHFQATRFLKRLRKFVIREHTLHTCSVLVKLLITFIHVNNKDRFIILFVL